MRGIIACASLLAWAFLVTPVSAAPLDDRCPRPPRRDTNGRVSFAGVGPDLALLCIVQKWGRFCRA